MSRPYRYRKQMSGLLDYHGFRTQTEEFLNDLDDGISAANAKIGNLSNLTTTDKSSVVAAINEVAAQSGGGGGGEEQFQKVYETTLEEAAESTIQIASEDMGGAFVDVVVYVHCQAPLNVDTIACDYWADAEASVGVDGGAVSVTSGADTYCSFACMSVGGLLFASQFMFDDSGTLPTVIDSGFPLLFEGRPAYPSQDKAGVSALDIVVGGPGGGHVFPIGTQITVFARRKVTA